MQYPLVRFLVHTFMKGQDSQGIGKEKSKEVWKAHGRAVCRVPFRLAMPVNPFSCCFRFTLYFFSVSLFLIVILREDGVLKLRIKTTVALFPLTVLLANCFANLNSL